MSHERERQVFVALAERDWRLIVATIQEECEYRGGDWIKWAKEIGSFIEVAIEPDTAADPGREEIAGPRCEECGCEVSWDYYPPANWMVYRCRNCGHYGHRKPTRLEAEEFGDPLAGLTDWQLGMIDDW